VPPSDDVRLRDQRPSRYVPLLAAAGVGSGETFHPWNNIPIRTSRPTRLISWIYTYALGDFALIKQCQG
jgi:hypothetical protein